MTDRVPGTHETDHVAVEALADAAEGLLTEAEVARVDDHLRDCRQCTEVARRLSAATAAVRRLPAPPMPADVAERLLALVREESLRRATGVADAEEAAGLAEAAKQTDLGSFRHNPLIDKNGASAQGHLVGRKPFSRPRSDE